MDKKKQKTKAKKSKVSRARENLIEAYISNRHLRPNAIYKLPEINPDFKEAYDFFNDLLQNMTDITEYSLKDIATRKSVPYEKILDWAKQNDIFAFGMDMAKQACFVNSLVNARDEVLEWEKAVKYIVENISDEPSEKDFWLQELEKIEADNLKKSKKVIEKEVIDGQATQRN